jgi:hypothetical protein
VREASFYGLLDVDVNILALVYTAGAKSNGGYLGIAGLSFSF